MPCKRFTKKSNKKPLGKGTPKGRFDITKVIINVAKKEKRNW